MAEQIQTIDNWSKGINSLKDPRYLEPLSPKSTTAECVELDNMDITEEGSLITSSGYEVFSELGSGSGGPQLLYNFEQDDDNAWLIIGHGDEYYTNTAADQTWTSIGDFGTAANYIGAVTYLGTSATRRAILGTDITANTIQKWDGTGNIAAIGGAPPTSGWIMEVFQGRLFVALGATLYYTSVEDETDFAGGGTIGFNDIITGLKVEGNRLVVFTKTYHQGVFFRFDDANVLSSALKEQFERQYGCLAPGSIQQEAANLIYWAEEGVHRLGTEENYAELVPRPQSISRWIDPTLRQIRKANRYKAASIYKNQQYFLAAPFNSNFNDKTFAFNTNFDAWTTRSGFNPSAFALFRDANYKEDVYFADANNPIIYKFNDRYNYAGSGYTRRVTSGEYIAGAPLRNKYWYWMKISGEIYTPTKFTVRIIVDNDFQDFEIDKSSLITSSFSQYLGQVYIGTGFVGGSMVNESSFKKFEEYIKFPMKLREGFAMQYKIFNNAPNQPFKITRIQFGWEYAPSGKIPSKHIN